VKIAQTEETEPVKAAQADEGKNEDDIKRQI